MAKGKKTGGRVAGTPNRRTLARLALVAAYDKDDEEAFLRGIMTSDSPLVTLRDRIDCAKALLTARRFAKEEPDLKLVEGQQPYGTDDPLIAPRTVPNSAEAQTARLTLLKRDG